MSTVTISNPQNPGGSNDTEINLLMTSITYPLTLTQNVEFAFPTNPAFVFKYDGTEIRLQSPNANTPYIKFTLSGGVWTATYDQYNRSSILNKLSFTHGVGSGVITCFFGSAPVLTPDGYKRIDSLQVGQYASTPEGHSAQIKRVSVTKCEAGPKTNPYVISKGMFGAERRVLISPTHKVMTSSGMVEACQLGLQREKYEGTLTYYNIELENQECMIVGGVVVESLAPVRRIVITKNQFVAMLNKKYGNITEEILQNIQRTCRIVSDTHIEVPTTSRK